MPNSDDANSVVGVGDEGCGEGVGGAACEGAGGDGGWMGANPKAMVERVGVAVLGSAKLAFGGGVVPSFAEATARPDCSSEDAGYATILQGIEGARVQQPSDRLVEHAGRARGVSKLPCEAV